MTQTQKQYQPCVKLRLKRVKLGFHRIKNSEVLNFEKKNLNLDNEEKNFKIKM